MYNRYLRGSQGEFIRAAAQPEAQSAPQQAPSPLAGASGALSRILEKLHLQDLDTADLLLLLMLFFLFEEKADEEILIALGLLLIL